MTRKTDRAKYPRQRYSDYQYNARTRHLPFELSFDEFIAITSQPCSYCGQFKDYSGIDRVNSSVGYYIGNCVPCCKMCNYMKLNFSTMEWYAHMKAILDFQQSQKGDN